MVLILFLPFWKIALLHCSTLLTSRVFAVSQCSVFPLLASSVFTASYRLIVSCLHWFAFSHNTVLLHVFSYLNLHVLSYATLAVLASSLSKWIFSVFPSQTNNRAGLHNTWPTGCMLSSKLFFLFSAYQQLPRDSQRCGSSSSSLLLAFPAMRRQELAGWDASDAWLFAQLLCVCHLAGWCLALVLPLAWLMAWWKIQVVQEVLVVLCWDVKRIL